MEVEFKWKADCPRAFYKMHRALESLGSVGPAQRWKLRDVYLDTPQGDLGAKKIAFRLRCSNGKWEATFKTKTAVVNGKAVRREETLPLPAATSFAQALHLLHTKKRWKNLPLQQLSPLFEIRNHRITRSFVMPRFSAEVAFDNCRIIVGKQRVLFKEIEMELKRGRVFALEKAALFLTQKSGLLYSDRSKIKTAIALLQTQKNKCKK